ncbi:hypothetical protein MAHJHV65_45170 [Mycobacterium avium subsp. hominissuis]
MRAQQQITDLLAGRLVPLGVYGASPQPHPRQILNDIKILARWVLSRKECHALYRHAPSPIVDLVAGESADSLHRQIRLQPSALQAGVAITAAMDLLASPNISALASNFGPLMQTEHESGASIAIAGRQTLTFPVRSAHDRALAIAIAGQRPPAIKHMRAPAR